MENTFIEQVHGEIVAVEKRLVLLKQLEAAYDPAAIAEVEQATVGKRGKKAAAKPEKKFEGTLEELREEVRSMKADDPELSPQAAAKALGRSTYLINKVW